MTTNSDFDRHAAAFLADGPTELADRVLDAALREVHLTDRRRRWMVPWRTPITKLPLGLAAAVAAIAIVGYAGLVLVGPRLGPAAPATQTPPPTTGPSPTPGPIDTGDWILYASAHNWVGIMFPRSWTAVDADHEWTMAKDAAWPNTAADRFVSPDGQVVVASWSALNPESLTLEAWIETYCPLATSPCTGLAERAVPVHADPGSRHSGLRIAFDDSVQAFFLDRDRIYAVAVWNAEFDPAVAPYGGATRLLEAFALSMCFDCASPVGSTARPG